MANAGEVTVYYFLQVASGHVLLPILLAVFVLSPKISRHPTLLNLVASYIISSICACLLLYAGQATGPEPNYTLCVVQAGFINSLSPTWATASFVLVINIWSTFRRAILRQEGRESVWQRMALLSAPYVIFIIWATSSLFMAFAYSDTVNRSRREYYCSMDYPSFTNAMSTYTAIVCFVMTGFQIHLGIMLYRNYRAMGERGFDLRFVVRTLFFGVYTLVGMFVTLTTVLAPNNSYSDIFAATFGIAVFLVFGTQADVFDALKFWEKKQTESRLSWSQTDLKQIETRDSIKKGLMV